jgi:hypothetical protein
MSDRVVIVGAGFGTMAIGREQAGIQDFDTSPCRVVPRPLSTKGASAA